MFQPRRLRAAAISTATILALGGAGPALADSADCLGPSSDTKITVFVEGVRNSEGLVAVTLYADDSSKFLVHHGSMYVVRAPAQEGTTRVCMYLPKPGIYAIAVYHDENADLKIDRGGILGIPTEGFGFSNNPPTIASLPSFRSVRLSVPKSGLGTKITLKYP